MRTSRRPARRSVVLGIAAATALSLVGTVGAAAEPVSGTVHRPTGQVVPDSYVVVYKKGVEPVRATAAVASSIGVKTRHVYSTALNGFSFTGTAAQAKKIAADPRVASVWADGVMRANVVKQPIPAPPNSPWGLDRIDQRSGTNRVYGYSATGYNVNVYVLDTGIRTGHAEFGGRAKVGKDFVGGNGQDANGHGTHVAGTIGGKTYGVAKSAKLVAVRVLGADGSGSTSGVIAGVDWVAKNAVQPAVANMSLGGGYYLPLNLAVTGAVERNVAFVVAAGNDGTDAGYYSPADTANALVVGSTGRYESSSNPISDTRSSFSNYGSALDLFAPGANIKSAYHTSNTATAVMSGTSMAAPHAAGAVALFRSRHTKLDALTAQAAVVQMATKNVVGDAKGSANRLLYVPTLLPTRSALDATPEPVKAGTTLRLIGRVSDFYAPGYGAPGSVQIHFKRSGTSTWQLKGTVKILGNGMVFAQYKAQYSGTWRMSYLGSTTYAKSSGTDAVTVK